MQPNKTTAIIKTKGSWGAIEVDMTVPISTWGPTWIQGVIAKCIAVAVLHFRYTSEQA